MVSVHVYHAYLFLKGIEVPYMNTCTLIITIREGFPLLNCICTCITYLGYKEHRYVFLNLLGFKVSNFYVLCIYFISNIKMA